MLRLRVLEPLITGSEWSRTWSTVTGPPLPGRPGGARRRGRSGWRHCPAGAPRRAPPAPGAPPGYPRATALDAEAAAGRADAPGEGLRRPASHAPRPAGMRAPWTASRAAAEWPTVRGRPHHGR